MYIRNILFSPLLYVTFWSMSMYDLYTPIERYEEEISKLEVSIMDVDENKEIVSFNYLLFLIKCTQEKTIKICCVVAKLFFLFFFFLSFLDIFIKKEKRKGTFSGTN